MLTGKEIAERGIISNFLKENIQQQGIDVRLLEVFKVDENGGGIIPAGNSRKTITPKTEKIACLPDGKNGEFGWMLKPGYYEVMFDEGCDIPNNCSLQFKTRSSGIRCAIEIRSGLFDAGFNTKNMGAFMKVELPIFIERHARVAQVIVDSSNEVENLYNGQWQGDNQRKDS